MQYSHSQITETLPFSNYWDCSYPKLTLPFNNVTGLCLALTPWLVQMDTQTTDNSKTTPRILPAYSQTNKLCLNKGSRALKRCAGSGRQYNICTQHPDYIHGHGYIIWLDQITPKLLFPLSIYYWMNQDTSLFLPLFGRWCWSLRLPFTPRLLPNQSHSLITT